MFERNGWIIDPMYHNSGDVSQRDNYDFGQVSKGVESDVSAVENQIVSIAKVTMAAIMMAAGYRLE